MALNDKLHESGWSDTTADDWFFKIDVLDAVNALKERYPNFVPAIDEIFGDLNLDYDDLNNLFDVKDTMDSMMSCLHCNKEAHSEKEIAIKMFKDHKYSIKLTIDDIDK